MMDKGMKKIFAMILAAGSMMIAVSCKGVFDENFTPDEETVYVTRTYSAGFGESTKTAIESSGKVVWEQGDVIRYYSKKEGEVKEYAIQKGAAHADLTLDVASTASFLIAAYGGTGLTGNLGTGVTIQGAIPAEQSGVFGDHHVAVTKTYEVTRESLTFHNLTSYIKFALSRDDVARVVFKSNDATQLNGEGINVAFVTESEDIKTVSFIGSGSNSITIDNGGAGTFFIATLPCVLAEGFQLDCFSADGTYLGSAITSKSLELRQNTVLNLGVLDSRLDMIRTDLSADGTANCYVVSAPGIYKFKADVKGGTPEALDGTPFCAEVLWESFGTDIQPEVGDIVSDVALKDGYITFTASGKDGNAVIAVKDAVGDILWSWHIWVCKGFDPAATAQVYYNNAGTVMDRNLGATSATKGDVKALGLLYQWGRKDPFLGSSSISSNTKAKSTISWPSTVPSDSSNGTIDFVVKHPTTFVTSKSGNYDWYYTGSSSTDNTRWNSDKGMYDPCPKGWKVPDGGSNGLWAKAFGTSSSWTTSSNWDSTNKGMDFGSTDKKLGSGEIWYPASGCLGSRGGTLSNVGYNGYYWSCTPDGYNAYYLYFDYNGLVYPSYRSRAVGHSVRCLQE